MDGKSRRSLFHRTALEIERRIDRRAAGRPVSRTPIISPYRSFGRPGELLVRGRVLLEKRITRATNAEPVWRNLLNTYRRFQSDELAGARVVASWREAVVESVTDEEGHFTIRLEVPSLVSSRETLWQEVALSLPDSGTLATAHVLVPSDSAAFAVISDIDDTIVRTNATSLFGMIRSVVGNAAARLPFEGVAGLYRLLHADRNPIFYVSSSPWNLYELLHDFMDLQGIPHGPMLLQDWGIDESTLLIASHTQHKLAQIQSLLDYYPALSFVLIGDSGQHDPEIYLRVIQAHPGRVRAVFIRDVTEDVRDRTVTLLAEEARSAGVEMIYVRDSAEAAAHARRLGLIS